MINHKLKIFLVILFSLLFSSGLGYFVGSKTAPIEWSEQTKFVLIQRTEQENFQHKFDIIGSERYFYLSSPKRVGVVGDTLSFQVLFTISN